MPTANATAAPLDPSRFQGALLGLASGDALGTTVEFKSPGSFTPVTEMTGGGLFKLPAGAWTDDTSMALCLAESLIECGGFDPADQLRRYLRWWREGHNSSTGSCFDIGGSTSKALARFERTGEPYPGDADPGGAGNAPLMKLAPVAMVYARQPEQAAEFAGQSARTTHGAPEATDAACWFAVLLVGALNGVAKDELLGVSVYGCQPGPINFDQLDPKIQEIAAGSYREKQPPEIKGLGYSPPALEAALWALYTTSSWEQGALAAVNLGDDADTTAAIYGQLAGAIYGVEAIPERWLELLVMREEIGGRAEGLFRLMVFNASRAAARDSGLTE